MITIDTNLTTTDFLDVTLDLFIEKYYPYRKPSDHPLYVYANFNHPPTILKQLPIIVNTRLSSLSINEDEFHKAKLLYEKVLKDRSFNKNLKFERIQTTSSPNRKKSCFFSKNQKEKRFGSIHRITQKWKQTSVKSCSN